MRRHVSTRSLALFIYGLPDLPNLNSLFRPNRRIQRPAWYWHELWAQTFGVWDQYVGYWCPYASISILLLVEITAGTVHAGVISSACPGSMLSSTLPILFSMHPILHACPLIRLALRSLQRSLCHHQRQYCQSGSHLQHHKAYVSLYYRRHGIHF